MGICDKLKKDEFYLMEVVMAEESSQQFTSTGTTSARNVSPTKASSVRPVNRQPIKQVSSNTQSPQTKYIYAGIGEQPLTQREFDENLKNLRSTLAEVESLLHGDMKNPENIKRCQQLLGFATSLRLPQEVKDKEIRSYPPAVQHLYETVKNEGSSASPAAQMAQTRHATTAMAQIMASDLRHETILKDLQTMDIDAVYDKYYGVQHEQDMIAMQESHQKFMDLLDMPLDTPEQRAEFERKAAAQLEEEKKRLEQERERKNREWEEIQRIKQVDPERGAELEKRFIKDGQEKIEGYKRLYQQLEEEQKKYPVGTQEWKSLENRKNVYGSFIEQYEKNGFEKKNDKTNTVPSQKIGSIANQRQFKPVPKSNSQNNLPVSEELGVIAEVDERKVVANAPSSIQSAKDTSQNLNGASGMVSARQRRAPINNTMPSNSEQPLAADAMASMGNGNVHASDDLDFGIVPGGSIGTTPIKPAGRSKGFKRGGIARINRTFDLGTIGLVSTTVAPKVPENTADNEPTITEQATINNSIVTTDNSSSSQKLADLTTTSDAKKENPLGKPVNLEETSDINLLTVRSQQSQAMV